MTFMELIRARYSVRSFDSRPIEPEKLQAVLEAGRLAPTAVNAQPQKIFVVQSQPALAALETCRHNFGAPVVLVLGYDRDLDWKNPHMSGVRSGETDVAIVCTHMMLEAFEQGLGSCWVGSFNADAVAAALHLPDNVCITALLPLGYAAADAKPSDRHALYRPMDEMVTYL